MKQAFIISFISLVLLTILSGCWSKRELNEIGIALAMGVDKKGDNYVVSFQVIVPQKFASDQQSSAPTYPPIITYTSKGNTLFEAERNLTKKVARKIFNQHLRLIVIGEELARKGIGDTLDFIYRDHSFRTDFYILLARSTSAEQVLSILTPLEKIPADKMFSSLETLQKNHASSTKITVDQMIMTLVKKEKEAVLPGIRVIGDSKRGNSLGNMGDSRPIANTLYSGIGVFQEDRLVGWLNEREAIGYNYIVGKVSDTVATIPCPGKVKGKMVLELTSEAAKVGAEVKDGLPVGNVNINAEGNIGEAMCKINIKEQKTIKQIQSLANQEIKRLTETTIKKVQKDFNSDIFGFGRALHLSNPDYWKNYGKKWNKQFPKLPVKVKVNFKIRRNGTISNSFLDRIKG